jgi:hypothetical protein
MERDVLQLIDKVNHLLPKPAHKKVPLILQLITPTLPRWARWEEDNGTISFIPVDLWALVQDHEGERFVYGMEADSFMEFIDDTGNFDRYVTKEQMDLELLNNK